MNRIGFLGVGKMGEAILASLIRGANVLPGQIVACDADARRRAQVKRCHGVKVVAEPGALAEACDTLVLAVKPQDLDAILEALAPALTRRHLLISIAAGKTVSRLQALSGGRARIVRVMPNLNVRVGAGMSVFTLGPTARTTDRRQVTRLLASCGEVIELDERQFDVVTALSGSGPAFYAFLARAMAHAAEQLALPAPAAMLLANQTMLGTARYLLESRQEPEAFIQAVCSRGGTTAAGMAVLEKSTVATVLARTIRAATRRSRELNKQ
jgi:pyrroline-5-carboxylate reductase